MKAIALLGGPQEEWPQEIAADIKKARKEGALIMASDRGSLFLLQLGIVPDVALGDYDSLSFEEREKVERKVQDMRYSNPIKDFTDSEMLFYAAFVDYQVENLTIYGATGGRLDHFLVNLYAVLKPPFNRFAEKIKFVDKQNLIRFFKEGKHIIAYNAAYKYLGIGTLTPVQNFYIKNARYDLAKTDLSAPTMYSSNEYLEGQNIEIGCRAGTLIVINSRDKK
ncbi:thiamine diphosphokinase [Lactobacillus taiwanensis]|uniref:thiamine diphosphokinase n=1 Tax=Lactobacillus taiwanensis TaxID=508451 RepID=UPI000B99BB22|nr:thiamine diphosphokinase [Lactobacillus taiwanensis]OYR99112.1 thiamine diphosphokinase [Lactobacillus taiwanensis]OYS02812.1 thiamine diphosphokinase [Lactobacillus taiwanensis]QTQ40548.1 thiamine diphosphokinase [Lactobacillus taiwanensis]